MGEIERIHRIDHSPAVRRLDQRDHLKKRREDEHGSDNRDDQDQVELTFLEDEEPEEATKPPTKNQQIPDADGHIDFSA